LEGSKNGLQSRLSEQESTTSQLKQDLVRATLAKQTLEYEKKELLRRVDELERGLTGIKNENGEKDKFIRAHKQQIEEFARKQRDFNLAASAAGVSYFTIISTCDF
jgi:chromosome segregation ATPase